MTELRYRQCDQCGRVLEAGVPFAIIALSMKGADVCSVECAQLWVTVQLENPQMQLPLCYDAQVGHAINFGSWDQDDGDRRGRAR